MGQICCTVQSVTATKGGYSVWRAPLQCLASLLVAASFAWVALVAADTVYLNLKLSECRECETFDNSEARVYVRSEGPSGRADLIYKPLLFVGFACFGSLCVLGGSASAIQWRKLKVARIAVAIAGVALILAMVPFVFFETTVDWYSWATD
jgi:hypothetical protein